MRTKKRQKSLNPFPQLVTRRFSMEQAIEQFLASGAPAVQLRRVANQPSRHRLLVSGAFNPWHNGHRQMAAHAAQKTGLPAECDLSVANVDKPDLSRDEILQRIDQVPLEYGLWLTRLPTFAAKSERFPDTVFVVGADTIMRIASPVYYNHSKRQRDAAFERIRANGCQFLVYGRVDANDDFLTLNRLPLPDELRTMCTNVRESEYRCDLSSTQLRADDPGN